MNVLVIMVFMSSVAAITVNEQVAPYCQKKCNINGKYYMHTVCQFKCQISESCIRFQGYPLNYEERQLMLDMHNEVRQKIASGSDTRGGMASAANMMVMNYDLAEEIPAICWSKRCRFGHDACRSSLKFSQGSGQNLYISNSTGPQYPGIIKYLNDTIQSWYDEIVLMSRIRLTHYSEGGVPKGKRVGHFTQMLWWWSRNLGCTRAYFITEKRARPISCVHVLCHYGPMGNFYTAAVYEIGPPASNCPYGTKPNSKYPALCGTLNPVPTDPPQLFPLSDPWAAYFAIGLRPTLNCLAKLLSSIVIIIYFTN